MRKHSKVMTVLYCTVLFIFAAFTFAQTTTFKSSEFVQKCPQASSMDPAKWSGVKWLIGSSTGRMFMSSQFFQDNYVNSPDNADLLTLTRLIERRGSHLIIMPIPGAPIFYGDILDKNDPKIRDFDFVKARANYEKLVTDNQKLGIHMVSLGAAVDGLQGEKEDFYLERDVHWSPTGAKASAKAIADYIAKTFPAEYKALPKSQHELSTN
jgi:hypothetical protein